MITIKIVSLYLRGTLRALGAQGRKTYCKKTFWFLTMGWRKRSTFSKAGTLHGKKEEKRDIIWELREIFKHLCWNQRTRWNRQFQASVPHQKIIITYRTLSPPWKTKVHSVPQAQREWEEGKPHFHKWHLVTGSEGNEADFIYKELSSVLLCFFLFWPIWQLPVGLMQGA